MKWELGPSWSEEQRAAGERLKQSWERFFSVVEGEPPRPGPTLVGRADELRVSAVRSRHEAKLLRYPNVVGVAEGIRVRAGTPTGEPCVVVYVSRKVPAAELGPDKVLPAEIEGIPVDVVEVGQIEPLPLR